VNTSGPGARAVAAYKIEDVFLVTADCSVSRDLNQTAISLSTELTYGQFSSVEESVLRQQRVSVKDGNQINIIRYYITTDVRFVRPGVALENREPTEEEHFARIKLTFAADYSCSQQNFDDTEAIGAFSRNAQFHAWPYIREEVSAFCGRMRLPRVMLPMWKPDQLPRTTTNSGADKDRQ